MNATIVSVGGGGYDVADKVRKSGLFAGAQLLVCDTDVVALVESTSHTDARFLIKRDREKETKAKPDDIRVLLEQIGDTIILCATLGGLTGSAYAPIIAHEVRRIGKFVCSIFTMPWDFEGRNQAATAARSALLTASDFAIQQNNDRFRAVAEGPCTINAWRENQGFIDILKLVLSDSTLKEWATVSDTEKLLSLIPENYRIPGEPYIELHANGCSA